MKAIKNQTQSFLDYSLKVRNLSFHTIRAYARAIAEWREFLTDNNEVEDARSFVYEMMERGLSPKSVNLAVTALREYYRYCCAFEGVSVNPFAAIKRVREEKHLPRFITSKTLSDYINNMPESTIWEVRSKAIIYLLYHTGLRCNEFTSLLKSDVSFGCVKVVSGKGRKERIVPITEETYSWFKKLINLSPTATCLFTKQGQPMTDRQLRFIVADALRGLPKEVRHPHALRHSCATTLLERGCRINFIAKFLGHASVETTEIYTHCSIAFLQQEYNQAIKR